MMYRSYEEIELEFLAEALDQGTSRWSDPFTLEAYQQLDL
jgi:hypothetical protein